MLTFRRFIANIRRSMWLTVAFIFLSGSSMGMLSMLVPASVAADSDSYSWPTAPCAWNGNTTGACSGYDWGLVNCPTGDGYCNSNNQINGYYLYDNWGYGFRNC